MRLAVFIAALLSSVAAVGVGAALAAPAQPPVAEEARAKAAALVAQMTLDEKVEQLLNVAPAIPRLGVPAYNWWTESLHGAIGEVATTNFPEPIGLAATFDAPLVHEVADTISVEVRALHTRGRETGRLGKIGTGLDTWSPNINIFRDPRWGRGQETYGEDPYLTARMAVAFVTGMQGPNPELPNVISTPKHFAVHSGPESTRHSADVYVSTHDLEDTYLPAFRAAIVQGRAGSVMCAYNRIDGQPACANDILLKDHLRGVWNFTGYVVSDCDAVVDIAEHHHYAPDPAAAVAAALKAGVDNECNTQTLGGATGLAERYKEAYRRGLIGMADIDQALVRLFSARFRNGDLAGLAERSPSHVPESEILTPAHRALALRTAEESLVLLKNDGLLPLKPGLKILVVGPHGDSTHVLRGNYSSALSAPPVSIVDGLRAVMPRAKITQAPFEPTLMDGDQVPDSALRTPDGQPGLKVERAGADEVRTGFLIPPESGTWRIGLTGVAGELQLDGKVVGKLETWRWGDLPTLWTVPLQKGRRYRIRVVSKGSSMSGELLVWKRVDAAWEDHLKAAAADADVIVAAVGLSSDLEGEEMPRQVEGFSGGDKTSLDLPAPQRRLLEQAKALGKPLVVVLMNGSPIDLSWEKDNASAILEAWYPGQSGGLAVADVLTGRSDPAGRLPLTFYRSVADLPPFDDYAMKGRTYRYFEGEPVYPFGYGLSYTRFAYTAPQIEPAAGGFENGARVTATVTNTGGRAGQEVAELYLKPPAFEGAPRLALRGFQRLSLAPGESRTVTFDLSPRDLSFVTRDGQRQTMPGRYEVSVGSGQPDAGVAARSTGFIMGKAVPIAP
jgi:beta-glucosidase